MKNTATVPTQPVLKPPAKKKRRYRYEFYRDNFRRMTVMAMGLIVLDVLLVLAMFLVYANFPQRDLYATTRNGLLVRLRQFDSKEQVMAAKAEKLAKAEKAAAKAAEEAAAAAEAAKAADAAANAENPAEAATAKPEAANP